MVKAGEAGGVLDVVLARLVSLQRPEIATLKAIGYRDRQIALHFLKLVTVIVALGALPGVGLGIWLGRAMTELYGVFFKFPELAYRLAKRAYRLGATRG